MPVVEMPDGTELDFPDEMAEADIRSAITSKYKAQQVEEEASVPNLMAPLPPLRVPPAISSSLAPSALPLSPVGDESAAVAEPILGEMAKEEAQGEVRPYQPGFLSRIRESEAGRRLLGPTSTELEAGAPPTQSPGEVASAMLKMTSVPPPIANLIRQNIRPSPKLGPVAGGIISGLEETALNLPIAPVPAGAGRAVLPIFATQWLAQQGEAKRAYQAALARGDTRTAALLATEEVAGGALLLPGTAAELRRIPKRPSTPETPTTEEPSAETIRRNQEKSSETGQVVEGGEAGRGGDVQQAPSGAPAVTPPPEAPLPPGGELLTTKALIDPGQAVPKDIEQALQAASLELSRSGYSKAQVAELPNKAVLQITPEGHIKMSSSDWMYGLLVDDALKNQGFERISLAEHKVPYGKNAALIVRDTSYKRVARQIQAPEVPSGGELLGKEVTPSAKEAQEKGPEVLAEQTGASGEVETATKVLERCTVKSVAEIAPMLAEVPPNEFRALLSAYKGRLAAGRPGVAADLGAAASTPADVTAIKSAHDATRAEIARLNDAATAAKDAGNNAEYLSLKNQAKDV